MALSGYAQVPAPAVADSALALRAQAPKSTLASPLVLADTTREYSLGRHWDVLAVRHDSVANVSFAQATSPAWAARFRPSHQDVLSYGVWRGQVWLRTTVVNQAAGHTAWMLRARLSSFEEQTIYLLKPNGRVEVLQVDPALSYAHSHNVPDRHVNLALSLPAGQPVTLYVCTRGGLLNFSICERRTLEVASYWESLFLAIFLGAMLMLALYNLFLFASIRERSYLYYVGYVLSFCLLHLQMKGLLSWWFFPHSNNVEQERTQLLLMGLVMFFGAQMARSFLETRRLVPRLDWLLLAVALAAPVPLLASFLPLGKWGVLFSLGLPAAANLPLVVVGTAVLRKGYRPARYYMAGWMLVAFSIMVFYLAQINVLPGNELTLNGSALAWILEMIFLSLGLADRINLSRQAEQQAQARTLGVLREKEDVQRLANRQLTDHAAELERTNAQLQASLSTTDHLQDLDTLKTIFFTNISHEFRTPLTLILGPAEELSVEGPDSTIRRSGQLILRNAQRLLRLINQLLDLSKLEAGAMQLVPTRGDAALLARQLAGTFASMAEARGIRFSTQGPVRLPFVFDAPKLEIVLTNLLSNALRFTPDGGEVALTWREVPATADAAAHLELAVRDSGPGIAAAHQPRLFNRFYQGEHPTTANAQPGTGVGLTLVKELTELHGGTVDVVSTAGEGATFTVRLPSGLVPAPAGPVPASNPVPAGAMLLAEGLGPEPAWPDGDEDAALPAPEADLVLVIEDNDDVREYIRTSLAPAGYRLLEAPDGLTGVALALEQVPDLIVSDVMMPGLDGYGVIRQLKAHPATSHVPMVLLTAKAGATDRLEGLETGADAHLGKPFAARELRAQVRNLLALRDRTSAQNRAAQHLMVGATGIIQTGEIPEQGLLPVRLSAIDREFLAKIEASVEENLGESEYDVDQLSSAVALSRAQVQRKLRALTGQAPAEYIRTARLHRALALLRERAGTVAEVGYQVGFSSPAHFSTVFSRQFGYPPSEVARQ